MSDFVSGTANNRTVNNTMRQQYRVLSDYEKATIDWFKETGEAFINHCENCGAINGGREFAIAKTKMEEAVMWAIKGVTA
jgi:hypothetical protein